MAISYDTPFGDGYMLGTFVQRTAKLGDGLVNFLTDVTAERRMEAELRSFADVVAHDLNEPMSTERARDLINGVLVYARAGELTTETVALSRLIAEVAEDLRASLEGAGATLDVGELPEVEADPRQLRRVLQNLLGNAVSTAARRPCWSSSRPCATARNGS